MKVTIITVCYNSEHTIERTIKSVLSQTYTDIEYIIIDGKSSDRTLDIVNKYRNVFENNLYVISEPDGGIYDAMNKGIHMAHGEIIGIINSDDWYEPTAVENVVTEVQKLGKEKVITYGFIRYWMGTKEESIHFFRHEFLQNRMISHPTCFVSNSVYKEIGVFDLTYKYAADYDFMIRAFRKKICFCPIYSMVANFQHGGASNTVKTELEVLKIKRKYKLISNGDYWRKFISYKITQFRIDIQKIFT